MFTLAIRHKVSPFRNIRRRQIVQRKSDTVHRNIHFAQGSTSPGEIESIVHLLKSALISNSRMTLLRNSPRHHVQSWQTKNGEKQMY